MNQYLLPANLIPNRAQTLKMNKTEDQNYENNIYEFI